MKLYLFLLYNYIIIKLSNCIVTCHTVQGTGATNGGESIVSCSNSSYTLVDCGFEAQNPNHEDQGTRTGWDGAYFDGNNCRARAGDWGTVKATARCCDLNDWGITNTQCENRISGTSIDQDDAPISLVCSTDYTLFGCTYISDSNIDGGCTSTGDICQVSDHGKKPIKCVGIDGNTGDGGITSRGRCCKSSFGYVNSDDIECILQYSGLNSNSVGCPNGYYLMSCNAFGSYNRLTAKSEYIWDSNGNCVINGGVSGGYTVANCCKFVPPTNMPTNIPTIYPTLYPTSTSHTPTILTVNPTNIPTKIPSITPTLITMNPTSQTLVPTLITNNPTNIPSIAPTLATLNPTSHTIIPTLLTLNPTNIPSTTPTISTLNPTPQTFIPTLLTTNPTNIPSKIPTNNPTINPTTLIPTNIPTIYPTNNPTLLPTQITTTINTINNPKTNNFEIKTLLYIIIGLLTVIIFLVICCMIVNCFLKRRKTTQIIINSLQSESVKNNTEIQLSNMQPETIIDQNEGNNKIVSDVNTEGVTEDKGNTTNIQSNNNIDDSDNDIHDDLYDVIKDTNGNITKNSGISTQQGNI